MTHLTCMPVTAVPLKSTGMRSGWRWERAAARRSRLVIGMAGLLGAPRLPISAGVCNKSRDTEEGHVPRSHAPVLARSGLPGMLDERPGPVLAEGRLQLLLGVHDDGTAPGHGLAEGTARYEEKADGGVVG